MNTAAVIVTSEICGTSVLLGAGLFAYGTARNALGTWREALDKGWVKCSVSAGTVAPGVRWDKPKRTERKVSEASAGTEADHAPSVPAGQARTVRGVA